jgi:hypothetical protein
MNGSSSLSSTSSVSSSRFWLHVDVAHGVVAEHPEVAVEVEVDRRGLDARRVERIDDDAAGATSSRMVRSERIIGARP